MDGKLMSGLYLLVEVFPEVLCHESEEWEEGPAECVKTCVVVVRITACFYTREALWTLSVIPRNTKKYFQFIQWKELSNLAH